MFLSTSGISRTINNAVWKVSKTITSLLVLDAFGAYAQASSNHHYSVTITPVSSLNFNNVSEVPFNQVWSVGMVARPNASEFDVVFSAEDANGSSALYTLSVDAEGAFSFINKFTQSHQAQITYSDIVLNYNVAKNNWLMTAYVEDIRHNVIYYASQEFSIDWLAQTDMYPVSTPLSLSSDDEDYLSDVAVSNSEVIYGFTQYRDNDDGLPNYQNQIIHFENNQFNSSEHIPSRNPQVAWVDPNSEIFTQDNHSIVATLVQGGEEYCQLGDSCGFYGINIKNNAYDNSSFHQLNFAPFISPRENIRFNTPAYSPAFIFNPHSNTLNMLLLAANDTFPSYNDCVLFLAQLTPEAEILQLKKLDMTTCILPQDSTAFISLAFPRLAVMPNGELLAFAVIEQFQLVPMLENIGYYQRNYQMWLQALDANAEALSAPYVYPITSNHNGVYNDTECFSFDVTVNNNNIIGIAYQCDYFTVEAVQRGGMIHFEDSNEISSGDFISFQLASTPPIASSTVSLTSTSSDTQFTSDTDVTFSTTGLATTELTATTMSDTLISFSHRDDTSVTEFTELTDLTSAIQTSSSDESSTLTATDSTFGQYTTSELQTTTTATEVETTTALTWPTITTRLSHTTVDSTFATSDELTSDVAATANPSSSQRSHIIFDVTLSGVSICIGFSCFLALLTCFLKQHQNPYLLVSDDNERNNSRRNYFGFFQEYFGNRFIEQEDAQLALELESFP
ncbi:MAG: hypothetical protein Tsb005_10750 [Gammaproteobacteria bacterium]